MNNPFPNAVGSNNINSLIKLNDFSIVKFFKNIKNKIFVYSKNCISTVETNAVFPYLVPNKLKNNLIVIRLKIKLKNSYHILLSV